MFRLFDYSNSLLVCEKAISALSQYSIFFAFEPLIKLKVELLYKLNDIQESRETYMELKYVCRLTENIFYFEKTTELFKTEYPNLFE